MADDCFYIKSSQQHVRRNGKDYDGYELELSNGKKYERVTEDCFNALSTLSEYSTRKSPEITPEELWEATDEIYKNASNRGEAVYRGIDTAVRGRSEGAVMLDSYDALTEHYQDENSPRGENITLDELYDLADILINWCKE